MSIVINQILTNALLELNRVPIGQAPAAAQSTYALGRLNQILDDWNADRAYVFSDQFLTYALVPSLNPHTIGAVGATWTLASGRPVSIEGVTILLSGSPVSQIPVRKMNAQWWQNLPVPTIESDIPTGFYYDPTLDNGSLYLYPIPNTAYDAQLWVRGVLAAVTQFQVVTLAPGYQSALEMTLAEQIAGPLRAPWTPEQKAQASQARARLRVNNQVVPAIRTQQAGMPRGSNSRANQWNWQTGNYVTP